MAAPRRLGYAPPSRCHPPVNHIIAMSALPASAAGAGSDHDGMPNR
jgi:hypothetical protein